MMTELLQEASLTPGTGLCVHTDDGTVYDIVAAGFNGDGVLESTIAKEPPVPHSPDTRPLELAHAFFIRLARGVIDRDFHIQSGERLHIYGKKPSGEWYSELTTKVISVETIDVA